MLRCFDIFLSTVLGHEKDLSLTKLNNMQPLFSEHDIDCDVRFDWGVLHAQGCCISTTTFGQSSLEKMYPERSTAGLRLEMLKVSWTSTSTHSEGKCNCSSHSLAANWIHGITAIRVNNYLHIHILLVPIGSNNKRNYV